MQSIRFVLACYIFLGTQKISSVAAFRGGAINSIIDRHVKIALHPRDTCTAPNSSPRAHVKHPYCGFDHLRECSQLRLSKGGGVNDGDDGRDIIDPNPGGMNNWGNGGDNEDEENLLDKFQNWLKSDEAKEDAKTYTISLLVALMLRFFIVEPRYIPSLSMYPTFQVGDQLAVESY